MALLEIGQTASISKAFNLEEVAAFAEATTDTNPVHTDADYAAKTTFGKPIVHGVLVMGLFSSLLGTKLPGRGTIYLGQNLKFLKPNFVGEKITAIIKLVEIREDKPIYTFKTTCYNFRNEVTIEGEAVVMYKGEVFV